MAVIVGTTGQPSVVSPGIRGPQGATGPEGGVNEFNARTGNVVLLAADIKSALGYTSPSTINVLDYGADPTGVADSTAAIQDAINAANNITIPGSYGPWLNRSVFFPNGIYLVSSQITVFNDVCLVAEQGSGARITTDMASGYLFQFVLNTGSQAPTNSKRLNNAMKGPFHLVNTNTTNIASAMLLGGTTASGGGCAHAVFDTVVTDGFAYAHTYGFNAYLLTFFNCNFYGCSSGGVVGFLPSISNSGEKLTYIGCVFFNGTGPVLLATPPLGFQFIGCSFDYMYPGSSNGMLISSGGAGASYTFSHCHFEWNQAGTLLVDNIGASYLNISNSTFAFGGSSAPEGFMYLGNGPFNVSVKNNRYYSSGQVFPYMYDTAAGISGILDVDDPGTIVPSSFFTNYIGGALPAGVVYLTQRIAPPATNNGQLVNLGQVANVTPIDINYKGGTAASTTYGSSASFTAPCAGWVCVDANFNNNTMNAFGDITEQIIVNGTTIDLAGATGTNSWFMTSSLAVAAGTACTATVQYVVGATALAGPVIIRGLVWFIPNP